MLVWLALAAGMGVQHDSCSSPLDKAMQPEGIWEQQARRNESPTLPVRPHAAAAAPPPGLPAQTAARVVGGVPVKGQQPVALEWGSGEDDLAAELEGTTEEGGPLLWCVQWLRVQ